MAALPQEGRVARHELAALTAHVERMAAERHAIVEAALDCIVAIDADGVVREFNPAAERTFGYNRDEAMGRRLSDLIVPAELRARHEAGLRRHVESGLPTLSGRRLHFEAVRADGSRLPVELTITRTGDDADPLFVGFLRDVTDARQAEEQRRAAEERHRTLIERLPLATYVTSAELPPRILFASPQIETLLGYTLTEWHEEASLVDRIVHPEDFDAVAVERERSRRDGDRFSLEYRMVHRDGREIWVQDTSSLVVDGERRVTQGFLLDVTERKLLEERLRQSQKMDAIGQLAGGIAHDFNNMLTAIGGYAELLGMTFDADDVRVADVEALKHATAHATALTRQLLAFSRKQVLLPRRLEANEVVADVVRILRRTIGEAIEIRTLLDVSVAPVNADHDALTQVLMNIALNARDAMATGGRLTIVTRREQRPNGPHVAICLTDTGCGMSEETQRRIFEPFFTTKPVGSGTGLGLATAYGIVTQSGGSIEVASEPGNGSTFRVLLPVVTAAAHAVQPAARSSA